MEPELSFMYKACNALVQNLHVSTESIRMLTETELPSYLPFPFGDDVQMEIHVSSFYCACYVLYMFQLMDTYF